MDENMRGTLLIYKPFAPKPEVQEIEGPPTLEALKAGIGGGFIEPVPHFKTIMYRGELRRCIAFCDETGKVCHPPLEDNIEATILWDKAMRAATGHGCHPDYLVGDIVVVMGDKE